MDTPPLSDPDLDALAAQVDDQLMSLRDAQSSTTRALAVEGHGVSALPDAPAQRAFIEQATGEPFETFWSRYRRHLRDDLCLPGGQLHGQWSKWRDLESKSAVRVSYAWLALMGVPSASIAPLAVAASVFVLNVVFKVGVDTICEGCAEEEKARREAASQPDKSQEA
jgi:hypothetical protein